MGKMYEHGNEDGHGHTQGKEHGHEHPPLKPEVLGWAMAETYGRAKPT